MWTESIFKVLAILPADRLKHKCLSFFFFSLFSVFTLELREKGHTIAIHRKGGGRKWFYGLLSFFDGFLLRVFSLLQASGILYSLAWRHWLSSCQRFFPLFPRVSVTVSTHLVMPTAVLKFGSTSLPGVSASDHTFSHGDLRPKNWIL